MKTRALKLLKLWCDTLMTYEIRHPSPHLDGALLCPACHVVHGRIGDLVYPLTTLWAKTGEICYLAAAERYIDFTEVNLIRPDGSYRNDLGNTWKGITAFSALAIGESLLEFGDSLPEALRDKWTGIFRRLSDFCESYFETISPNINYFAGVSAELALAYKLFGDEKFINKANRWEKFCREHFDENGLFFGESHPIDLLSENGSRGIDMGYNLEESIPLLIMHAVYTGDSEKLAFYKARMLDHMEFLLPDGAIDNSFGTRHNKWTYWGSRTSDGIIEGLALILDEPVFAKACDCVLSLYESCTNDGLLGLPMALDAGEPTCLHHAFCHAKALAALVNSELEPAAFGDARLPREYERGVLEFQNGNVLTVSVGGWRATFSATGINCYSGSDNSGGSMTLLWNEAVGPICAATMHKYSPSEPLNMQFLRKADLSPCMTPRLEIGGYSSDTDKHVKLTHTDNTVTATAKEWSAEWSFTESSVEAIIKCEKPAKFILPLVCATTTSASIEDSKLCVGKITLEASKPISADTDKRVFNQVSGFNFIPAQIDFEGELKLKLIV